MHVYFNNIQPSVNDKCPDCFLYFAGNLRTQNPNKSQIKRANIMGLQYFCGIWSCLGAHQKEWCQLHPIIYPLCITTPHNLHQLTLFSFSSVTNIVRLNSQSTPLPPTEYSTSSVWEYITASIPTDKQIQYNNDDATRC